MNASGLDAIIRSHNFAKLIYILGKMNAFHCRLKNFSPLLELTIKHWSSTKKVISSYYCCFISLLICAMLSTTVRYQLFIKFFSSSLAFRNHGIVVAAPLHNPKCSPVTLHLLRWIAQQIVTKSSILTSQFRILFFVMYISNHGR